MGLPILGGFTTTEMLSAITVAGILGSAATPQIISIADRADHIKLKYARSALYSSVQMVRMAGLAKNSSYIGVEGKIVELKYGYPKAEEIELRKIIELDGFNVVNKTTSIVVIWSPNEKYCFTYSEATHRENTTAPALLSEISSADSRTCQT